MSASRNASPESLSFGYGGPCSFNPRTMRNSRRCSLLPTEPWTSTTFYRLFLPVLQWLLRPRSKECNLRRKLCRNQPIVLSMTFYLQCIFLKFNRYKVTTNRPSRLPHEASHHMNGPETRLHKFHRTIPRTVVLTSTTIKTLQV